MASKVELVLLGGGEHARVVVEAARTAGFEVLGFLDPNPSPLTENAVAAPRLGDDGEVERFVRLGVRFVVGVGNIGVSPVRAKLVARLAGSGVRFATVIHASASVAASATVGEGSVVLAGAVVSSLANIGAHVILNSGSIIEHDVAVEDFVHVGPAAAVGGGARIASGAYLGLGSRVRDHVTVGANATVGMGAAVISDVRDEAVVVGVPARERRRS